MGIRRLRRSGLNEIDLIFFTAEPESRLSSAENGKLMELLLERTSKAFLIASFLQCDRTRKLMIRKIIVMNFYFY